MIKWEKLSRESAELAHNIAFRAFKLLTKQEVEQHGLKLHELEMDICAAHLRSPINLEGLLSATDSDLGHDVFGIRRFIDRDTGFLKHGFSPRWSK